MDSGCCLSICTACCLPVLNYGELGEESKREGVGGRGCLCSHFHGGDIVLFFALTVASYIGFQSLLTFKGALCEAHPASSLQRARCMCLPSGVPALVVQRYILVIFCPLCLIFLHFKTWGFLFPNGICVFICHHNNSHMQKCDFLSNEETQLPSDFSFDLYFHS